ncbi:MAG: hypothetical protein M0026_01515 [Nocardiopsaceae bacterium]|nr:hypothetical protein [Nocardiopsaceae bacterium]
MVRPQPGFRTARAALFAAVCVGMALIGHVAAGGSAPGPLAFCAAIAGTALLALPFAGRQRSAGSLMAGLLGAQVALHLLFGLVDRIGGLPPGVPAAAVAHMCGASLRQGDGAAMVIAHLWAALVTGWWLASGEEALWVVLRWLWAALLVPPLAADGRRPARPIDRYGRAPMATPRLRVLRHAVDGRAPPEIPA